MPNTPAPQLFNRVVLACLLVNALASAAAAAQAPVLGKDAFEKVRSLLKDKQFAQAEAVLESYASPADASPTSVYLLGIVRLQSGRLADAQIQVGRLRKQATSTAMSLSEIFDRLLGISGAPGNRFTA